MAFAIALAIGACPPLINYSDIVDIGFSLFALKLFIFS
jgi:hypothetical protein